MAAPKEQPIPPDALGNSEAVEVLRAFVVDGGLSISFTRAFEDPQMWGMLLVDVARHAARVFEKEGVCTETEALGAHLRDVRGGIRHPTDLGRTDETNGRGH